MITYPVDVTNDRFTFKLDGDVKRGVRWPRTDGLQIQNANPSLVILKESTAALPSFDPATQTLDTGSWADDPVNQTAVFTRSVVQLSAQEIAKRADNAAREVKRQSVAQAIPTLRTWATQLQGVTVTAGNAVTVLQGLVDRQKVFYDRFADLLEAQRIDQQTP